MDSALVDNASEQFLGQWRRLVSTTNWEKGRIIHEWREALRAGDAPSSECSDEAWSRRVGNVTPQHVGRLRRVYDRFATVREAFPGLFWSHFQAALDWDDAEMWLEGAVHSDWSIEEMRQERYRAHGGTGDQPPDAAQVEPWDEDAEPAAEAAEGTVATVRGPERDEGPAQVDDDELQGYDHAQFDEGSEAAAGDAVASAVEAARPFADLPPLPADVQDAFEAYKLCILRHKLSGWLEISRDDLLASLDALRQLTLAPADAS